MQYQLKIQQLVPYAASTFCIDAIYSCSRRMDDACERVNEDIQEEDREGNCCCTGKITTE